MLNIFDHNNAPANRFYTHMFVSKESEAFTNCVRSVLSPNLIRMPICTLNLKNTLKAARAHILYAKRTTWNHAVNAKYIKYGSNSCAYSIFNSHFSHTHTQQRFHFRFVTVHFEKKKCKQPNQCDEISFHSIIYKSITFSSGWNGIIATTGLSVSNICVHIFKAIKCISQSGLWWSSSYGNL